MICYEKTCEVCYGQPRPCPACGDTGTVPTEAGKALLGFLERHAQKDKETTRPGDKEKG